MRGVIWSIKEIVSILKTRQKNEFDGNMAITGDRGNGKSTLINKIFLRFDNFKPWKHQVYSRDDVINLLRAQTYGLCWDDEAINSSYKRDFQYKGQQELIKILTAYRDNYNVFASAIPSFFSLDKDLRDLYFIHLHVIERGIAVIHMPLQGRLYSQDRWDSKYNSKIEENWSKKIQSDPNFKPPYYKLTTFRGYLFFNDVTPNQKKLYKEIKRTKRAESFKIESDGNNVSSFLDKLFNMLKEKKLTKDGLMLMCEMEGKKYSSTNSSLNRMLTDSGETLTVKDFLQQPDNKDFHNKEQSKIKDIVPSFKGNFA